MMGWGLCESPDMLFDMLFDNGDSDEDLDSEDE